MKIRNIALDDEGDPATITAEMTLAEAVFLTKLLGSTKTTDAQVVTVRGGESNHSIHDALDQLLLKFWGEGADEAEGKLL